MNAHLIVINNFIWTFLFASGCNILHRVPEQSIPQSITSRISEFVMSCPSSPENHTLSPPLAPLYSATVDCFLLRPWWTILELSYWVGFELTQVSKRDLEYPEVGDIIP